MNGTEICRDTSNGSLDPKQALHIHLASLLLERYLRYYYALPTDPLRSQGFHSSRVCPITLVVILDFRGGYYTSPVRRVAAAHLLVEVLEVGRVMRRSDRRILLVVARSLVVELLLLLARGGPVIAVIVEVLR